MEQKQKKGRGAVIALALLTAVVLAANIACGIFFSAINAFMAANLNTRLPGAKDIGIHSLSLTPDQAEQASKEMAQELESEGIVLLENKNSTLPLESGQAVNLFGYASIDPVYGGSGSGAGDNSGNVDLVQGLTEAGFAVNQELVDFYKNSGVSRPVASGFSGADFKGEYTAYIPSLKVSYCPTKNSPEALSKLENDQPSGMYWFYGTRCWGKPSAQEMFNRPVSDWFSNVGGYWYFINKIYQPTKVFILADSWKAGTSHCQISQIRNAGDNGDFATLHGDRGVMTFGDGHVEGVTGNDSVLLDNLFDYYVDDNEVTISI